MALTNIIPSRSSLLWDSLVHAITNDEIEKLIREIIWFVTVSLAIASAYASSSHLLPTWYEQSMVESTLYLSFSALGSVWAFARTLSMHWLEWCLFVFGLCIMGVGFSRVLRSGTSAQGHQMQGDWACFDASIHNSMQTLGRIGPIFYGLVMGILLLMILLNKRMLHLVRWLRRKIFKKQYSKPFIKSHDCVQSCTKIIGFIVQHSRFLLSQFRFLVTLAFLCVTWLELSYIIILRRSLHAFSQDVESEDAWGFGQVIAVLLWLPVLLKFVIKFCKCHRYAIKLKRILTKAEY